MKKNAPKKIYKISVPVGILLLAIIVVLTYSRKNGTPVSLRYDEETKMLSVGRTESAWNFANVKYKQQKDTLELFVYDKPFFLSFPWDKKLGLQVDASVPEPVSFIRYKASLIRLTDLTAKRGFVVSPSGTNLYSAGATGCEESLSVRMTQFFRETLRANYQIKDDAKLYEAFLTDYFNYFQQINTNSKVEFLKTIDAEKLEQINRQLFVRDTAHYYRFYAEVILKKASEIKPDAPLRPGEMGADTVIIQEGEPRMKMIFDDFYASHNVIVSPAFAAFVREQKNETADWLGRELDHSREIAFIRLAMHLSQTDAQVELEDESVRTMVAIVFWKLICLQAGQDFHTLK